jgi:tetratricopeptide (TPR) repeat protein
MMSERWLYAGSIAFCLGMGWVWEQVRYRQSLALRRGLNVLGALILLALSVRAEAAVRIWRTDFSLFGVILSEHPRLPKAHLWLADSYNRVDSLALAEKHFRIALALSPDNPEVHADLGILYDKQGRLQEAIQEYQTALLLGGENALPRLNLGITYEHLGHYQEALGEYQKVLSLGAERPKAFFRMGECYLQLGDTLRAREAYAQALSLDPAFVEAGKRLSLLPR